MVTFHKWYTQNVLPNLYSEQAMYEKQSMAFQAIERLSFEQIINLFQSMTLGELRLALFDHVKNCIEEQWDPDAEPPEFREDEA